MAVDVDAGERPFGTVNVTRLVELEVKDVDVETAAEDNGSDCGTPSLVILMVSEVPDPVYTQLISAAPQVYISPGFPNANKGSPMPVEGREVEVVDILTREERVGRENEGIQARPERFVTAEVRYYRRSYFY